MKGIAESEALIKRLREEVELIPDVQSSWALLLHCAAARANYYIRVVPPELSDEFATSRGSALWMCLSRVLDMPPDARDRSARDVASLAAGFWWHGTSKCCPNGGSSLLVQLGGRTEHDFTATQNNGDHSRA